MLCKHDEQQSCTLWYLEELLVLPQPILLPYKGSKHFWDRGYFSRKCAIMEMAILFENRPFPISDIWLAFNNFSFQLPAEYLLQLSTLVCCSMWSFGGHTLCQLMLQPIPVRPPKALSMEIPLVHHLFQTQTMLEALFGMSCQKEVFLGREKLLLWQLQFLVSQSTHWWTSEEKGWGKLWWEDTLQTGR